MAALRVAVLGSLALLLAGGGPWAAGQKRKEVRAGRGWAVLRALPASGRVVQRRALRRPLRGQQRAPPQRGVSPDPPRSPERPQPVLPGFNYGCIVLEAQKSIGFGEKKCKSVLVTFSCSLSVAGK